MAAPANLRKLKVRERRCGQFLRIAGGQIRGVDVAVVGREELGQVNVAHTPAQAGASRFDGAQRTAVGFGQILIHAQAPLRAEIQILIPLFPGLR